MANLLEIFQETVGDKLSVQASSFLGENPENTATATSMLLPAILGGLVQKGTTAKGVTAIFDYIKNDNIESSLPDIPGLFGGGETTNQLIEKGVGILDFLFGEVPGPVNTIIGVVTERSGLGSGSVHTLMKMVAPVLMSTLGRQVKNQSLDPIGLNRLLIEQKDYVQGAAPEGLFTKLGFTLSQDEPEEEEQPEAVSSEPGTVSKIVPWIILICLALGLFYVMKSCGGRESETTPITGSEPAEVPVEAEKTPTTADTLKTTEAPLTDAIGGATRSAEGGTVWINLPDEEEIETREGSLTDRLFQHLNNEEADPRKRFTLDELVFQEGSSNIAPSSVAQLETVASLLKGYPAAKIRIEGNTDNQGDPEANKTLSQQQALAVKFVLTELGVAHERIETTGLGEENPLESNETPAGRRANRRIDLFVVSK
jgi:OmpA-OmpF porin, OOP family